MSGREKTKVLVVGGGPGGYVAAIRAGQLGMSTILVEADRLGGTCLLRGCIPSKALIHVAETFALTRSAAEDNALGIRVGGAVTIDLERSQIWKDGIVNRLSSGVAGLLRKANVRVVNGWGAFRDGKTCQVSLTGGGVLDIEAENVVLACGSESVSLPNLPFGGDVLSSTEALALRSPPLRLAVVGAGYIGLELGMAFAKLGSKVTIVEAADRILPQYDAALTEPLSKALKTLGVDVLTGAQAQEFVAGSLRVDVNGMARHVTADKVLVTVGRRPRTAGWGLDRMGIDMDGAFVRIDERCATSMARVWAIGDLTGEPMLAHRASAQGAMVAEIIAGQRREFRPAAIPAICFTDPEIVTVGRHEATSDMLTAVFPLNANGRALTLESAAPGGFVRVAARPGDQRIVGFAAVGRNVSELSGEMTALIEMGAVLDDVASIIHAHPTQSETLAEAAMRGLGHALHI